MTTSAPGYPEYTALIASNARLETKIDLVLQRLDVQDADIRQIRSRVEDLEKSRAHSKGALAVIGAVGGLIGALATSLLKNFLPH